MLTTDGESESWTEWSQCQTPCPWTWCQNTVCIGAQTRNRSCAPHLSNNATIKCTGALSEKQFCLIAECPVKEIWSDWTEWSACGVTCGSGYRQRVRFCADRENSCHGDPIEWELCGSEIKCERLDQLGIWGEWSACSQSCGGIGEEGEFVVTWKIKTARDLRRSLSSALNTYVKVHVQNHYSFPFFSFKQYSSIVGFKSTQNIRTFVLS